MKLIFSLLLCSFCLFDPRAKEQVEFLFDFIHLTSCVYLLLFGQPPFASKPSLLVLLIHLPSILPFNLVVVFAFRRLHSDLG